MRPDEDVRAWAAQRRQSLFRTLGVFVPEGDGDYLSVQLPPELHWTGDVAARFVDGLDVTDQAAHTVG